MRTLCAQGDTNAELVGALRDGIRYDAVSPTAARASASRANAAEEPCDQRLWSNLILAEPIKKAGLAAGPVVRNYLRM